jgi:glucose/arabinose dehydrogenase
MYVSIGWRSNNSDDPSEANRARIFEFNPEGTDQNVYVWGIRNAVSIAFRLGTNELWMSTNERDELGDDLPPDYISSVKPDGFYGWPWFYIGNHVDPHHKGQHLRAKPLCKTSSCKRTRRHSIFVFTPASSFQSNTKATSSPHSTAPGIVRGALVIKSCACLLTTRLAKCSAITKISLPAS